MFSWFRHRRRQKRNAHDLYGSIVTLSRRPEFYTRYGLADTVEARFEVLVVHVFLFLERLRRQGESAAPLAQALVDEFFADMDTTIRELGVGDMAVPNKMRSLSAVFSDRLETYRAAAGARDAGPLAALLAGNLGNGGSLAGSDAVPLARYMRDSLARLERLPVGDLRGFADKGMANGAPLRKESVPGS